MTLLISSLQDANVPLFVPVQTEHSKEPAHLDQEITPSTQRTDTVFKNKVIEVKSAIQKEKQKCEADLLLLNGAYYQDPKSMLKMAWDELVQYVSQVGLNIESADQLESISDQLKRDQTPAKQSALSKIDIFKDAEELRNQRQAQLNRILATEKIVANPEELLKQQQAELKQKHHTLCGDYFGDPNGQLDQAWRRYQTAIADGSNDESPLAAYQKLETERKKIEARLYQIEQQFSSPVSFQTFEQLATEALEQQLLEFKTIGKTTSLFKTKKSLLRAKNLCVEPKDPFLSANFDAIAAKATRTALSDAGYIMPR